ncbi:MAG: aminopeptidase N [Planctomycetes bacterium]|nr:aminopeptidase N [Planctomycetota bacterium]
MTDAATATPTAPITKYRKDYQPPTHLVDTLELEFDLAEEHTRVRSKMTLRENPASDAEGGDLVLAGEDIELVSVSVDGAELSEDRYEVGEESLSLTGLPAECVLEIEVLIKPQENTRFEGLYRSGPMFLTQCEAEGFRRITYFLDRPDVMARYTTTVRAERERYPILLSNGNLVDSGESDDGRHWARWEDPFPKPSYLFALVAGDLHCHPGSFTTASGREVELRVYVEHQHADKCEHATVSLERSMRWDEESFGLEYDLDLYMIVATDDFNMGAMENKGLNIFNSALVLARPDTATDTDYERIEGVIGHEYFHNWTGNRVTCMDWFQLTLKEGLTVFRDQQFTADMTSHAVKRIDDVRGLRAAQFPQDAGPMAHSIRPDSYEEMSNFYTSTVYEKGAEVIRMYHTLLGAEGFREGMDLYFERHDGCAVTCDDFRAAMADAGGRDLTQFERWYLQAGTPILEVEDSYEAGASQRTFTFKQSTPPTPGQEEKLPLHIPVVFGLIGPDGADIPLRLTGEEGAQGTTRTLELTDEVQSFTFEDVPEGCVPSYLRGFSAPVELRCERTHAEYAFQMANDSDSFNRWEAGQQFAMELLVGMVEAIGRGEAPVLAPAFIDAWGAVLTDDELDPALVSLALALPAESYLSERFEVLDPGHVHAAREAARRQLAEAHADALRGVRARCYTGEPYSADKASIARRKLANTCLAYLIALEEADAVAACVAQFEAADNMTDSVAALMCLCDGAGDERDAALTSFYERWREEPVVIDKWFALQAVSDREDTVERVMELAKHPDFTLKNPNRARSLLGHFGMANAAHFHRPDGAGYRFLTDHLIEMDSLNPQIASRLITPLLKWKSLEPTRRELMKAELERIAAKGDLSKDVREKVGKALA